MRILGKATWLVGPCVAGFLSGCAMMPSQKPVASVAPMPADVVLRQAEIQAYKEGFEAGQQVQRRRDTALAAAQMSRQPDPAPPASPAPASQTAQAALAPSGPVVSIPVPSPGPSYATSGPAKPVGTATDSF